MIDTPSSDYFSNQEWLKQRGGRFTASEIHKLFVGGKAKDQLFGDGAMTYINRKIHEILTGEVKEETSFTATEWGHANEADAKDWYEKATGVKGEYHGGGNPMFVEMGEYAGCSPDWLNHELKRGAQFKCHWDGALHVRDMQIKNMAQLKVKYKEAYHQCQMEMLVMKFNTWDLVSYDPRVIDERKRGHIIRCTPDREWVAEFGMRLVRAIKEVEAVIYSEPDNLIETIEEEKLLTQ